MRHVAPSSVARRRQATRPLLIAIASAASSSSRNDALLQVREASLSNKPAIFEANVNAVKLRELPALDDAFAEKIRPGLTWKELEKEVEIAVNSEAQDATKAARDVEVRARTEPAPRRRLRRRRPLPRCESTGGSPAASLRDAGREGGRRAAGAPGPSRLASARTAPPSLNVPHPRARAHRCRASR